MAHRKHPEDEGIPPSDDNVPERPSDDNEQESPLPADRPLEANDLVTAAEQRRGESVRTRLARERPEPDADDVDTSGERRTAGRLVEPTDEGSDVTRELQADETEDDAGLSAEEVAVTVSEPDERMPDEPSTDEASGRGADRGA